MEYNLQGVVGQIARVHELANGWLERELENRELEGLQPAHGTVLAFLFQQKTPVPIKDIVERVRRVKSTVTGMVSTLERYSYVQKTPSPEDGRVVYVELTAKGLALRADFDRISKDLIKTVYGKMSGADRKALVRLLAQVEENIKTNPGTE